MPEMPALPDILSVHCIYVDEENIGTIICRRDCLMLIISQMYGIPIQKIILFDYHAINNPPVPLSVFEVENGMLLKIMNSDWIPNGF
ncbi:hypothetical protein NPIL_634401 [Nephila pilipes]|uniref:Uncharacterized protein n=1 Tax=Nephila pilipes TaxID=299642 RepID=A0A8X6IGM6_NEPPI|nr:hypothetical protein NPIL_634401 [Nephila pilipes]